MILVDVREHMLSTPDNPLWNAIVIEDDNQIFQTTYAGDKPSCDKVSRDWLDDKNTTRIKNWCPGL